jgi:hypothetical protein
LDDDPIAFVEVLRTFGLLFKDRQKTFSALASKFSDLCDRPAKEADVLAFDNAR